ncbi:hypothetical protein [Sphingobium sp. TomTYG45]
MLGEGDTNSADNGVIRPTRQPTPFEDVGKQLSQFVEGVIAMGKAIVEGLGHLAIYAKRSELIEQAGWLPHPVAPFDMIPFDQDAAAVGAMLEAHYKDKWADIRNQFAARVDTYDIDDEAKATYREALELHQLGHYRAVVRLLFPEIERVACKEVYLGDQYERRIDGKKDGLITSLKSLREAAGNNLGVSEIGDIQYSLSLFQRMSDHLYEKVGEDNFAIRKYEGDPVPNRHAAMHGLVIYKTFNNSINTLIMTEFMFMVINSLKSHINKHQQD